MIKLNIRKLLNDIDAAADTYKKISGPANCHFFLLNSRNFKCMILIWCFYSFLPFIAKLNSNFNFSLSFELSLALLSNFPTTRVSSESFVPVAENLI